MKLVLRDDDTCFYTRPEELEQAFAGLPNVPICLSVVPYAAYGHGNNRPYGDAQPREGFPDIGENHPLVKYLQAGMEQGNYELLLHGVHHQYHPNGAGSWKTEMQVLNQEQVRQGILAGKKRLEELFGMKVSTFIGPSNDIPAHCAAVLDELGLHANYMVSKHFNRRLNTANAANYLRCNLFRARTGQRYAGVLKYKNHCEVASFPFEGYEKMKARCQTCKKYGHPLVIYTHYWSLNRNPEEKAEYIAFVKWALAEGAEIVPMSQLWKQD